MYIAYWSIEVDLNILAEKKPPKTFFFDQITFKHIVTTFPFQVYTKERSETKQNNKNPKMIVSSLFLWH